MKTKTKTKRRFRPRVDQLDRRALLTAGALDTTFGGGTGAMLFYAQSEPTGPSSAVAVQGDLKTVVAGNVVRYYKNIGNRLDIVVARFNVDGTPDTTFGSGGQVDLNVQGINSQPHAVSVQMQADGKIVVAGSTTVTVGAHKTAVSKYELLVLRLNSNGSLDTSFNGTGKAILDDPSFSALSARALQIQGNGQIVVAATNAVGPTDIHGLLVARYNPNGTLDTTFGTGGQGYVATSTGSALSMALDGSGRILVGGLDTNSSGVYLSAVFRFTSTGSPDTTFGTSNNGEVLITPPPNTSTVAPESQVFAIGLQSTGKIVAAGNFYNPYGGVFRLNTDGTLDTTFGNSGYFEDPSATVGSLAVQPDDKLVLGGGQVVATGGTNSFEVDRVLASGTLDTTFGTGGQTVYAFAGSVNAGGNAIIGPNGEITAAGGVNLGGTTSNNVPCGVIRLLNDITTNLATATTTTFAATPMTATASPSPSLISLALESPDLMSPLWTKRHRKP